MQDDGDDLLLSPDEPRSAVAGAGVTGVGGNGMPAWTAAAAGANNPDAAAGCVTPTSPYALQEMMRGGGGGGVGGEAALSPAVGPGEASGDLKNKWGFTPGADDTLDVSHGEQEELSLPYHHSCGWEL
jgi:hypothetical protein